MPSKPSPALLRLSTWLPPPLGLILLWRGSRSLGRKLFGSLGILLYCLPYSAFIIWLLIRFTGLQVEWRGGFPPVLTYSKTLPNYDAVERHRAQQTKSPVPEPPANTNAAPYWTDFRGPNRDGHYDELPIRTNWPATGLRLLWRQPIGAGYGSMVIAEGLVFTIEQRREFEVAVAYALETGREVWTNAWPALFQETMGGDGPRASTPPPAGPSGPRTSSPTTPPATSAMACPLHHSSSMASSSSKPAAVMGNPSPLTTPRPAPTFGKRFPTPPLTVPRCS
jgi:hypothetical protein